MAVGEGSTTRSAGDVVRIRPSRRDWAGQVAMGIGFLVLGVLCRRQGAAVAWIPLSLGLLYLAGGLWARTVGVDLTGDAIVLRGLRRRTIPWPAVQAVLPHRRLGSDCVRLALDDGKEVVLRAPTTWWGIGEERYLRDYHRIGTWWLGHRGENWRPVAPQAPRG